jgi:sec-independent protein translocase protein TatA
MDLGPGEILLIVAAIAVLFGAKRLPEIARSLGRARSEFLEGLREGEHPGSGPTGPAGPGSAQPGERQIGQDELGPGSGA